MLSPRFRELLSGADPSDPADEVLEPALLSLFDAGRAAWPHATLDAEAFARRLGFHASGNRPIDAYLARVSPADFYLACAFLGGDAAARENLGGLAHRVVVQTLRRFRADRDEASDLGQIAIEEMLVGRAGAPARLAKYSGKGSLEGWLRVTAARIMLTELRRSSPEGDADRLSERLLAAAPQAELRLLSSEHRATAASAIRDAVGGLRPEDRTLLRLHVVDGLSGAQIAKLYGVNRSTVTRWYQRIRDDVLAAALSAFRRRIAVSDSEFASIVVDLQSQLDLSIRRVLSDGAK